jgi:protein CWC15
LEAKRRRILEETRDIDADSDEAEDDSSEDDRLELTADYTWTGADSLIVTTTKTKQQNSNEN